MSWIVALLLGSAPAVAREEPPPLVVLVVVDQLMPDYLERFEAHLDGFFGRLREQGRWFTEAEHRHAHTVTGAGHASVGTGRFPCHHGIVGNSLLDEEGRGVRSASDPDAGPVEGLGGGSSAVRLLRDGLGDWLQASHPGAQVMGVAGKPRAAIFTSGKHPTDCYWFDGRTGLSTSTYYRDSLPEWVKDFVAEEPWSAYPEQWTRTLEPDEFAALGCTGDDQRGEVPSGHPPTASFPHGLVSPQAALRGRLLEMSPYGDQLVLDFALRAVEEQELGMDEVPDLLCLGLSATDRLGHSHGPDSWELCEQVLFLDRALELFAEQLEEWLGEGSVLYVVTSDHGVAPLPEVRVGRGQYGERLDISPLFRELAGLLPEFGGEGAASWWQRAPDGSLLLDKEVLAAAGLDPREVAAQVVERARASELLLDARAWYQLESAEDELGELLRNSYHPTRSGHVFLVPPPYTLSAGSVGTTHGSPHDYDRRVPLVFLGPGVEPGEVPGRAWTVDVAPTLAEVLGVAVPEDVDGRALALRDAEVR